MSTTYNAQNMEILDPLEGIRRRPGMYIGSAGEAGLLQCMTEAFANSIDEVANKHGDLIQIRLLDPIGFEVTDNGRGIPVDPWKDTNISVLTFLFTKVHSGGKLTTESNYKSSIGSYGVGCKILNALSDKLTVTVWRNNETYEQSFSRGKILTELKKVAKQPDYPHGTKVTWIPDSQIFKETIEYNFNNVRDRIQTNAYLNPNVKFKLIDDRTNKSVIIESKNGLIDMMTDKLGEDNKSLFKPAYIKTEDDKTLTEIIFTYTDNSYETLYSYVNGLYMIEGGTHVQGFRTGFTKAINDIARQNGYLKDKDSNITGLELREGLMGIINIRLPNPEFENQTKTKLSNADIVTKIADIVYKFMISWASTKQKDAKALVDRVLLTRKVKEATKKAREIVLGTKSAKKNNLTMMDGKLAHCSSKKPEECEIYLVEGRPLNCSRKNLLIAGTY